MELPSLLPSKFRPILFPSPRKLDQEHNTRDSCISTFHSALSSSRRFSPSKGCNPLVTFPKLTALKCFASNLILVKQEKGSFNPKIYWAILRKATFPGPLYCANLKTKKTKPQFIQSHQGGGGWGEGKMNSLLRPGT